MGKYELGKTVEARKLNKRTGAPLSEPPVSVPYGAILDAVQMSDDLVRFAYMGERYQVAKAEVAGALNPLAPPPPKAAAAKVESGDKLVFETLDVRSQGQVSIYRAPVPGGWLVASQSGALAFVPDPEHTWDGASVPLSTTA